jgi:hypothetical protein
MYPTPCIHTDGKGLCPACQADYDADPSAWEEFGQHPAGIANWRALEEEIAAEAERIRKLPPVPDDPTIPF